MTAIIHDAMQRYSTLGGVQVKIAWNPSVYRSVPTIPFIHQGGIINIDQSDHRFSNRSENEVRQQLRMQMILLSFAVSILLMGLKFLTYYLTHSSAVLSDALESIINVVAAAFATISVWMSAKPPDPEHPYGHGKIEYFSAGFEGALIICAAAGIFYTGIQHLLTPHSIPHLEKGLIILVSATTVNFLLGAALIRVGRRTNSVTLIADGKHIITDAYTSGAVILGLVIVYWTGWLWLDGMVACIVGINILVTGGNLVRQSFARLMDASDPLLLDRIANILNKHRRSEWIDVHQLRAWQAGSLTHIDLHLVLPKQLSIEEAHAQAKAMELLLIKKLEDNASVLVHMDPCNSSMCPICNQNECQQGKNIQRAQSSWDRQYLIRSSNGR